MSTRSDPDVTYQPGVAVNDLRLILDATPANVWQALRGQRIFITGGTGFVGCWLLEALLWADHQLSLDLCLTVLSRQPDAFRMKAPHLASHPAVHLVAGNVSNLQNVIDPFDIVIHAATDVTKSEADALTAFDNIVRGAKESLELARRCQARRYLLTSSGAVYGQQPSGITHVSEDYPGAPNTMASGSAYGQAKRVAEWMARCHAEQYGLEIRIARCFALLGPYSPLDSNFAAGNFIRDALNGQDIQVNGDGTPYRSYLYAADMVVWLLTVLINGRADQAYNLGSEKQITVGELARDISRIILGSEMVRLGAQPALHAQPLRYVPSTRRAQSELGLREYTDLTTAIRKTADWAARRTGLLKLEMPSEDVNI